MIVELFWYSVMGAIIGFLAGFFRQERGPVNRVESPREGIKQATENNLQAASNCVAEDAVERYNIAKRSGSPMDAYFQSGLVAAAYLQAKDEANYRKWKSVETGEATLVGLRQ